LITLNSLESYEIFRDSRDSKGWIQDRVKLSAISKRDSSRDSESLKKDSGDSKKDSGGLTTELKSPIDRG